MARETSAGAGYSGTPLARKLGIAPGQVVALLDEPGAVVTDELPDGVDVRRQARGPVDVIVAFVTSRAALSRRLPALLRALAVDGSLWVAWPKRSSGVATDMTEDVVRAVALPTGMVDNKVCAVDATWSGLRLVLRKELRPGRSRAAG